MGSGRHEQFTDQDGWWRTAVVDQVYPRSSADGNLEGDLANRRARAAKIRRERLGTLAATVVVAVVVLGMLTPFVRAGLTAVRPFWAAFTNPPTWSLTPQFDAFSDLWLQRGADETSTYQSLAAASIALTLPIAFFAVAAREYLVAGLGGGAVKG